MRLVRGIATFGLFAFAAGSALAITDRDWGDCVQEADWDYKIRGCTLVIEDPGQTTGDRSKAFYNRGIAFGRKRDYDRAIADFSEAIRLDPRLGFAYDNRGGMYQAKRDYDRAIADHSEAIRIDPRHARAHYNRAIAYRDKGDRERAIADLRKAGELGHPRAREQLEKLGVTL